MSGWTRRLHRRDPSQELQQVRNAAADLARQSSHAPGKARVVFQTVADVAFIATAVIGAGLATVHLYKALFPKDHEGPHGDAPEPGKAGTGRMWRRWRRGRGNWPGAGNIAVPDRPDNTTERCVRP